jgi:hypothetical protein
MSASTTNVNGTGGWVEQRWQQNGQQDQAVMTRCRAWGLFSRASGQDARTLFVRRFCQNGARDGVEGGNRLVQRRSSKSGHSRSLKNSSEYAACHSRKLLMRISPPVRISRSGSGTWASAMARFRLASVMGSPRAASDAAAWAMSQRPP